MQLPFYICVWHYRSSQAGHTGSSFYVPEVHYICKWHCSGSCEPGSRCHPSECIFGGEKPQGVGILEAGVYEQGKEMGRAVYKQSETKVDGSCHSLEGSK